MRRRPFQSTRPPSSPLTEHQRLAFKAFHDGIWIQEHSIPRPTRRLTPLEWAGLWDAIRAHGLAAHPVPHPKDPGMRIAIVHRPEQAPDEDPIILLDARHAPDEASWRAEIEASIPDRASGVVVRLDDDAEPASGTFG